MTENDYCLLYDIASKRIADLESKNAELREKSKRQSGNYKHDVDMLIKSDGHKNKVCKELAHQANVLQDQLAQTKDLLKRMHNAYSTLIRETGVSVYPAEVYYEVYNFLKGEGVNE